MGSGALIPTEASHKSGPSFPPKPDPFCLLSHLLPTRPSPPTRYHPSSGSLTSQLVPPALSLQLWLALLTVISNPLNPLPAPTHSLALDKTRPHSPTSHSSLLLPLGRAGSPRPLFQLWKPPRPITQGSVPPSIPFGLSLSTGSSPSAVQLALGSPILIHKQT